MLNVIGRVVVGGLFLLAGFLFTLGVGHTVEELMMVVLILWGVLGGVLLLLDWTLSETGRVLRSVIESREMGSEVESGD